MANLRMESHIRVSVSERWVIGVGGIEEMSWMGIWRSDLECGLVVKGRDLLDSVSS